MVLTDNENRDRLAAHRAVSIVILLVVVGLPLMGCHRSILSLFVPYQGETFVMDPQSVDPQREMFDGVANQMLEREQFPERRLAARGFIDSRLEAAGITKLASNELVGIVIDSDLQPVADSTVADYSRQQMGEVVTDDRGIFRYPEYDSKTGVLLLISKLGYSPRIITGRSAKDNKLLAILGNQTCIEGIVTGPDNEPVSGARIIASCGPFEFQPHRWSNPFPFETSSGDDGSYRIDVCSNRYDITVSAPGVGVARHTRVIVEPNQSLQRPIQLEKGIRFEATVVDSITGEPFEGFVLYAHLPFKVSGRSDAQGRIVLENRFPGVNTFMCGAGEILREDEAEWSQRTRIAEVSGHGENIRERDWWGHGPLGRWWSADATQIHERYFISELSADIENGKVTHETWQRNFGFLTFDIKPDMSPVKIVVEQGVTVTGIVTDPEGNPVAGATVVAALSSMGIPLGSGGTAKTNGEGRYRTVLPASHHRKYNMVAHDGDIEEWRHWANGVSVPMQTKPGDVIENIDITLANPGVIRGRLTYRGKPVADREVFTHSCDGRDNPFYEPHTITAKDGSFELKGVRPGKHYLQAEPRFMKAEYDPKGYRSVEVKPGEVVDNVEFSLKGIEREE